MNKKAKNQSWKQSKARYYCDVLQTLPETYYNPDLLSIEPRFVIFFVI
jgi:hypothetical protein